MIVYNTTFHVEDAVAEKLIAYLKKTYIPIAIKTGVLRNPALRRLLHDEEESVSFALQFHVDTRDALEAWKLKEGRLLQRRLTNLFGHQLIGFSTLLEEIELNAEG